VSQSNIEVVRGLGAIFDTTYYALYAVISIVAAILGTIILSKKRNIFEVLGMLGGFIIPNERRSWGSVRDESTRKPIPFAVVRLSEIKSDSNKLQGKAENIIQTVSDLDGRYRLYLNNASLKYQISVHAAGYVDLSSDLDLHTDPTKSNLFIEDLYLTKLTKEKVGIVTNLNYMRPRFYWYLIIAFYILSLFYVITGTFYVVAFPDSVYGVAQLAIFAVAFIWNTKILWERTHASRGRLMDNNTKQKLPNISLDLFDGSVQLTNTISDTSGFVKFDVKPGKYQLRLSSNLYKLESDQEFIPVQVNNDGYIDKDIMLLPIFHTKAGSKSKIKFDNEVKDGNNPFS
jgi:hypothetical protein